MTQSPDAVQVPPTATVPGGRQSPALVLLMMQRSPIAHCDDQRQRRSGRQIPSTMSHSSEPGQSARVVQRIPQRLRSLQTQVPVEHV